MKTLYTEQYYRDNWDTMMVSGLPKDRINMEDELKTRMNIYVGLQLSQDDLDKIRNVEADKIATKYDKKLKQQMVVIKDMLNGKSTLGYTTQNQEIKARNELRKRFEFNCLQLSDFRKKYQCVQ